MQQLVRGIKASKSAGVFINNLNDLLAYSQQFSLPASVPLLTDRTARPPAALVASVASDTLFIPMDVSAYNIHGACYTGPHQIQWMGQLAKMPGEWQVHIDGKYKLHHAKWLLLTIGTHRLRYDVANQTLSNSFIPLVYLFCKEGESDGACHLLTHALVATAKKYFNVKLTPGSGSTDHASALRKCMVDEWPAIEYGQCYPHLIRKYREGQFFKGTSIKKTWEKFEKGGDMITDIHLCGTPPMKGLVIREVGKIWDVWGHQMDTFWDSNCTPPWDCWSICDMTTMLSTPSNQVQETWHKQLMLSIIPGLFKGSTTGVISETLPKLIRMDGTRIPDILGFDVSNVLNSSPLPWPFPSDSPPRSSGVCRCLPSPPASCRRRSGTWTTSARTSTSLATGRAASSGMS